ncbi:MAG: hypothetical protein J2P55_07005, partial [Rhizobiales bacterium]|nr:hypothetical protein [Hyphomicrobiales bacterium]
MAARAQPRVKAFQYGGENDPYDAGDNQDVTGGVDYNDFLRQIQAQPPQTEPARAPIPASGGVDFNDFVSAAAGRQQPAGGGVDFDKFVAASQNLPRLAKGAPGMLEAAGISGAYQAPEAAGGLAAGIYGARLGALAGAPLAEVTAGLSV